MRMFSFLYQKMLGWAKHRHAQYYLFGLSFAESSFFPLPPDFMLAPMSLAQPNRAFYYAWWTTIASTLGGIFGYVLGYYFFSFIHPFIIQTGYETSYQQIVNWFNTWGFWVIFLAGFSPIPYKLFTVAGGALHMHLVPFILSSIIGRGGRFFLVCGLIRWGGESMQNALNKYIDIIGWSVVGMVMIAGIVWCCFS